LFVQAASHPTAIESGRVTLTAPAFFIGMDNDKQANENQLV